MADHKEHQGTSSSSSSYGHNIPILLGIENYSIWATRMRFSLGGLQALGLIKANPPQTINGNFSAANVKLTGQALFLMTSKMGNATIDFVNVTDTVKKLWFRLYLQYYEKGWGAKYILFQKLICLRHFNCEGTGDYVGKLCKLFQRLANVKRVFKNWWLVYLFLVA